MSAREIEFFLDPGCPWTWVTSRWLVDVAAQRDLDVRWRPFSLALLNAGRPVPPAFDTPDFRARTATAGRALAVITALGRAGDHRRAGDFYTEFGRRFHGSATGDASDPVDAAVTAAGVDATVVAAAGSDAVRTAITDELARAVRLAGPDIGSPVLRIGDADRGLHGPILSSPVTGEAATRIFDALVTLHADDRFFEIKRGRTGPPTW